MKKILLALGLVASVNAMAGTDNLYCTVDHYIDYTKYSKGVYVISETGAKIQFDASRDRIITSKNVFKQAGNSYIDARDMNVTEYVDGISRDKLSIMTSEKNAFNPTGVKFSLSIIDRALITGSCSLSNVADISMFVDVTTRPLK
jgi:hypothetical protein